MEQDWVKTGTRNELLRMQDNLSKNKPEAKKQRAKRAADLST